jgi:hypothetical protein
MRRHQRCILVIHVARSRHGPVDVRAVRQLRRRGQHLHIEACPIHQSQPRIEIGTTARADAALGCGIGSTEVDQYVEIRVGPVVRVHVDPHVCQRYSLNATPTSVQ